MRDFYFEFGIIAIKIENIIAPIIAPLVSINTSVNWLVLPATNS